MNSRFFNEWFATFTKRWVSLTLFLCLIDLQLSYLLAFLGKEQIAESLSSEIATTIVGTMGFYMIKALLETYLEKREERLTGELSFEEDAMNREG